MKSQNSCKIELNDGCNTHGPGNCVSFVSDTTYIEGATYDNVHQTTTFDTNFVFKDQSPGRGNDTWISSTQIENRNCDSRALGNVEEGKDFEANFYYESKDFLLLGCVPPL